MRQLPKLIGLVGKKQSGKDTVLGILKDMFNSGYDIQRIAFADAVKEEVAQACNVSLEYLEKNKDKFRLILQWWGTDFRRNMYGENYWISQWETIYLAKSNCGYDYVVVPDVRFLNEAKCIKHYGGELWRIDRCEAIHDNHQSETELEQIKCDYKIYNTTTLEDLKLRVEMTLEN